MKRLFTHVSFLLAISFLSGTALADLPVITVNEAALPYSFSPSNYSNSPSNYSNSLTNYYNAASNYNNSTSNYTNSSSNFKNGHSGSSRLIYSNTFVGYYVASPQEVINFFSPSGDRIFYNPKNTSAVFSSIDGSFCGVIAQSGGKLSLALTAQGLKLLLLSR